MASPKIQNTELEAFCWRQGSWAQGCRTGTWVSFVWATWETVASSSWQIPTSFFNSTKRSLFLPGRVWQLRVDKEEVIISNSMYLQNEKTWGISTPFLPNSEVLFPTLLLNFCIQKPWSEEQWLKCWPLHSWRSALLEIWCIPFLLLSSTIHPEIWRRSESPHARGEVGQVSRFLQRMCHLLGQHTWRFSIAVANIKGSLEHVFI